MEVEVGLLGELLKLQESGQFPDESAKTEGARIHPGDALALAGIKEIAREGLLS